MEKKGFRGRYKNLKNGENFRGIIQSKVIFFGRVLENINKRRENCQEIENESLW